MLFKNHEIAKKAPAVPELSSHSWIGFPFHWNGLRPCSASGLIRAPVFLMLCIICFSVIKSTGKCSKCRLRTLAWTTQSLFAWMKVRRLELSITTRHSCPLPPCGSTCQTNFCPVVTSLWSLDRWSQSVLSDWNWCLGCFSLGLPSLGNYW